MQSSIHLPRESCGGGSHEAQVSPIAVLGSVSPDVLNQQRRWLKEGVTGPRLEGGLPLTELVSGGL